MKKWILSASAVLAIGILSITAAFALNDGEAEEATLPLEDAPVSSAVCAPDHPDCNNTAINGEDGETSGSIGICDPDQPKFTEAPVADGVLQEVPDDSGSAVAPGAGPVRDPALHSDDVRPTTIEPGLVEQPAS